MKKIYLLLICVMIFFTSTCSLFVLMPRKEKNVSIRINTNPQGANFNINYGTIFQTPYEIELLKNEIYNISVYKDGCQPTSIVYKCDGSDILVNLDLGNPINNWVIITVNSDPQGAYFRINSGDINPNPTPTNYNFKIGQSYPIIFIKEGYKSQSIIYLSTGSNINVKLIPN